MKLNIKNTIFISVAMVIWGIYLQLIDTTVQIVVVKNLGQTEEVKGIILGIIGFLPIVLFPLFAKLSDNTKTKIGRRAPFIFAGTVIAVIMIILAGVFADRGSVLGYAVFFMLSYLGISIYRPAATAILPDITPKPLRSKANAIKGIINASGGLIVLGLVAVLGDKKTLLIYIISAVFMAVILVLYMTNINEPKLVREAELAMAEYEGAMKDGQTLSDDEKPFDENGPKGYKYVLAMPKAERKSLFLILSSMVFITFGYGAMIATYQNYAHEVWGMTNSAATVFMLLIGAGGLVSTPVIAKLSDTKGRKYTIVLGMIIFMAGAAAIIFFENIAAMRYIGFTVMGSGYAFVTIISFPMVLELSNTQNNGAFTSYYTLAFTIPKALTAYTSGVLLTRIGYSILFPYTLFFIILGLVLMVFVRHGNVVEIKRKQSEVTV